MDIRLTRSWIALLIIIGSVLIIYSNIYQCPFVFDDIPWIEENDNIQALSHYWSSEELFRPRGIVQMTFALNYSFGELNPFGYHLVNILIHIMSGFVCYFLSLNILSRVIEDPIDYDKGNPDFLPHKITMSALFAALVFVCHPIQTQAVTYTVQRSTAMAALFYMASVLFYLKARFIQQDDKKRRRKSAIVDRGGEGLGGKQIKKRGKGLPAAYLVMASISGILAVMSKQNAASLPGVILLSEYLLIDRTWTGWKKRMPWFALTFILWGLFVFFILGFFSGAVSERGFLEDFSKLSQETAYVSRWDYLCTQFNVLVLYIRLLIFPSGQSIDHFFPFMSSFFDGYTPLAFLCLIGIIVFGIWQLKKRPVITFGILWFFITLSVESSLIPIRDAMVEHRLYLPMFGVSLMVSYLVFYLLPRHVAWMTACAIIVALGVTTYVRNGAWQDKITIWSDAVEKNQQNPRAHYNLGCQLGEKGYSDKAIRHYSIAVRLYPEYAKAHYNMANELDKKGSRDEAISHYVKAIRANPEYVGAYYNLGLNLADKGDLESAARHFSQAINIDPDHADAHYNLGLTLYKMGDMDRAIYHFIRSLKSDPRMADAHNNLGNALAVKGKLREAIQHYIAALNISPDFADARKNLKMVRQRLQKNAKGLSD